MDNLRDGWDSSQGRQLGDVKTASLVQQPQIRPAQCVRRRIGTVRAQSRVVSSSAAVSAQELVKPSRRGVSEGLGLGLSDGTAKLGDAGQTIAITAPDLIALHGSAALRPGFVERIPH